MKRCIRAVAIGIVGIASYFLLAKFVGNVDPTIILSALENASLPLLLIALTLRGLAVPLHAMEILFSAKAVGAELRLRDSYGVASASIGAEYVVPVGGIGEVYKVISLNRKGLDIVTAVKTMFVHRTVLSTSLAMLAIVVIVCLPRLVEDTNLMKVFLLAIALFSATSIIGVFLSSTKVFRRFVGKLASKIPALSVLLRVGVDSEEEVAKRMDAKWFILGVVVAIGERLAIALSAYFLAMSLGLVLPLYVCILVFDLLRLVVWLAPAITPGAIGLFEAIQFSVMIAYLGDSKLAFILPLASRLIEIMVVLPQCVTAFTMDVSSFFADLKSLQRSKSQ